MRPNLVAIKVTGKATDFSVASLRCSFPMPLLHHTCLFSHVQLNVHVLRSESISVMQMYST